MDALDLLKEDIVWITVYMWLLFITVNVAATATATKPTRTSLGHIHEPVTMKCLVIRWSPVILGSFINTDRNGHDEVISKDEVITLRLSFQLCYYYTKWGRFCLRKRVFWETTARMPTKTWLESQLNCLRYLEYFAIIASPLFMLWSVIKVSLDLHKLFWRKDRTWALKSLLYSVTLARKPRFSSFLVVVLQSMGGESTKMRRCRTCTTIMHHAGRTWPMKALGPGPSRLSIWTKWRRPWWIFVFT